MGIITNRRRVMGGKALPDDAVVEWLESTSNGGQKIDTGIANYGFNSMRFVERFLIPSNYRLLIVGNYENVVRGTLNIEITADKKLRFYSGNVIGILADIVENDVLSLDTPIDIDVRCDCADGNLVYDIRDGASAYNGTAAFSTNNPCAGTRNMCLFTDWRSTTAIKNKVRVYLFKMYGDDVLLRDFIPVRVGQVGYMYDRVSGQLFGNAGTGAFVVGPDVKR